MDIIGDSLAKRIADYLGETHVPLERKVFKDKEARTQINGEFGSEVVLAIEMGGDPNRYMMELYLTSRTIRSILDKRHEEESYKGSIICVVPYLVYSRQDMAFKPGQPISIVYNLELLCNSGIDQIITVNTHARMDRIGERDYLHDISAISKIVNSIPEFDVVVGPDKGTISQLEEIKKLKGVDYFDLDKTRDSETNDVTKMEGELDVEGKRVLIFDDMVSSGGTIIKCLNKVREAGAKKIYVATVHGLFLNDSLGEIEKLCDGVFATDTVPNKANNISVTSLIGQKIRELQKD
jgi:ribose-phosphate pyrophosphokinase